MSFEERTTRIELLIGMIERSNTGSAKELARKLGVSRRTVFNDIEFLRGKGFPIVFNLWNTSYRFEKKRKKLQLF